MTSVYGIYYDLKDENTLKLKSERVLTLSLWHLLLLSITIPQGNDLCQMFSYLNHTGNRN